MNDKTSKKVVKIEEDSPFIIFTFSDSSSLKASKSAYSIFIPTHMQSSSSFVSTTCNMIEVGDTIIEVFNIRGD